MRDPAHHLKRCTFKKAYIKRQDAERTAKDFTHKTKQLNRVYACGNHFHISSKPKKSCSLCKHGGRTDEWCKWCLIEANQK